MASVAQHFVCGGGGNNTCGENIFFSLPKQQIIFALLYSTVKLIHFKEPT